jgi:hypothetical protein
MPWDKLFERGEQLSGDATKFHGPTTCGTVMGITNSSGGGLFSMGSSMAIVARYVSVRVEEQD